MINLTPEIPTDDIFDLEPKDINDLTSSINTPLPDWIDEFRPQQMEAVEDIVRGLSKSDVKVVFLDAPTGTGKTLIAEVVRRIFNVKANYVCSTKTLQDQFLNDFDYSRVLKGRSNYPTELFSARFKPGEWSSLSAEDCNYTYGAGCSWCENKSSCPYEIAKGEARKANLAVLNAAYILREWGLDNSVFSSRPLTIIDECDTLEGNLMSFVEVYISERRINKMRIRRPEKKTVSDTWDSWADETLEIVKEWLSHIPVESNDPKVIKEARTLRNLYQNLRILQQGLKEGEWVYTGYGKGKDSGPIIFKPVHVRDYAREYLWSRGEKFLLMSATVISPSQMAEDLGLEEHEWEAVTVDSAFAPGSRPIYVAPVADVTKKNKDQAWPLLGKALERIIAKHDSDNILVHTVSYELGDYVTNNLVEILGRKGKRILAYKNAGQREGILNEFKRSTGNILVAPSMDRGVDLPGDLCRVQVILKVPFPYLGDKQVSARLYSRGGQSWYAVETIRTIVQMSGRAVRSKEDYAVTYILDKQFISNVYKKNKRYLPKWWEEALVWDGQVKKELMR